MKKGLSLVEIIVVLAIIAVVIAISGVSISYIAPKKSEAGARRIVNELSQLRGLAVAGYGNVTLMEARFNYDSGSNRYYITPYEGSTQKQKIYLDPAVHITTPATPFSVFFYTIYEKRRGVADNDNNPANGLGDSDIYINSKLKVQVIGDTGYIRYVK